MKDIENIINQCLANADFEVFFQALEQVQDGFERDHYLETAVRTAKLLNDLNALKRCAFAINEVTYSHHSLEDIIAYLVANRHIDLALDLAFSIAVQKNAWFTFAETLLKHQLLPESYHTFKYLDENYQKSTIALGWLQVLSPLEAGNDYFFWLNQAILATQYSTYMLPLEHLISSFDANKPNRLELIEYLQTLSESREKTQLVRKLLLVAALDDDQSAIAMLEQTATDDIDALVSNDTGTWSVNLAALTAFERRPFIQKLCELHSTELYQYCIATKAASYANELYSIAIEVSLKQQKLSCALSIAALLPYQSMKTTLYSFDFFIFGDEHWQQMLTLFNDEDVVGSSAHHLVRKAPEQLLARRRRQAKPRYVAAIVDRFSGEDRINRTHPAFDALYRDCGVLIELNETAVAEQCAMKFVKAKYRDALLLSLLTSMLRNKALINPENDFSSLYRALHDQGIAKNIKKIAQAYREGRWHQCLNEIAKCKLPCEHLALDVMQQLLASANSPMAALNTILQSQVLNEDIFRPLVDSIIDTLFSISIKEKKLEALLLRLIDHQDNAIVTKVILRLLNLEKYQLAIHCIAHIVPETSDVRDNEFFNEDIERDFDHTVYSCSSVDDALRVLHYYTVTTTDPNSLIQAFLQANRLDLASVCRLYWLDAQPASPTANNLAIVDNWPSSVELENYLNQQVAQAMIVRNMSWSGQALVRMPQSERQQWQEYHDIWFADTPLNDRVDSLVRSLEVESRNSSMRTFLCWLKQHGFSENASVRYWQHLVYFLRKSHAHHVNTEVQLSELINLQCADEYFQSWSMTRRKVMTAAKYHMALMQCSPKVHPAFSFITTAWLRALSYNFKALQVNGQDQLILNCIHYIVVNMKQDDDRFVAAKSTIESVLKSLIKQYIDCADIDKARILLECAETLISSYDKQNCQITMAKCYFNEGEFQLAYNILSELLTRPSYVYLSTALDFCLALIDAGRLNTAIQFRNQFLSDANEEQHVKLIEAYLTADAITSARTWCDKMIATPDRKLKMQSKVLAAYQTKIQRCLGSDGKTRMITINNVLDNIAKLKSLSLTDESQLNEYNQIKDSSIQELRILFEKAVADFVRQHFGSHKSLKGKDGNIYFALLEDYRFRKQFPDCFRYCKELEKTVIDSQFKKWMRVHMKLSNKAKHDPTYLEAQPTIFGQSIDMRKFIPTLLDHLTKIMLKLYNPRFSDKEITQLSPSYFGDYQQLAHQPNTNLVGMQPLFAV